MALIQLCFLQVWMLGALARQVGKFEEVYAWKQVTFDVKPEELTAANVEFTQYNNVPMGVERVENRLFVTIPRRRNGVVSTLNYIDLSSKEQSPALKPYPDLTFSKTMVSVYRTRADKCGRLWMVDNGMLEIPNNYQQIQPPALVIFDLKTNKQILRYEFKPTDIISPLTPTGLSSITVDIVDNDCKKAFAYVPDLATYGLIVFSLEEQDSWRLTHNYMHFSPTVSDVRVSGQRFQWSDGIFSMTLTEADSKGCKSAYFHPLISYHEFKVSTCVLRNKTISSDPNYWTYFTMVGNRGPNGQAITHDYHAPTKTIFFAEVGRDSVSCWNTNKPLSPATTVILARDEITMSYPADVHVYNDEVWVMVNKFPIFLYSRLDANQFNFYIYKGKVQDLIADTDCEEGDHHHHHQQHHATSGYHHNNHYNRHRGY